MTQAEERLYEVEARLKDRGVRAVHFCWAEGAKERCSRDELCDAISAGLEKYLDGDYELVDLKTVDGAPL